MPRWTSSACSGCGPVLVGGVRSADRDVVGQDGRPVRVGHVVVHDRRRAGVAHDVDDDAGVGRREHREGAVAHRHDDEVAVGVPRLDVVQHRGVGRGSGSVPHGQVPGAGGIDDGDLDTDGGDRRAQVRLDPDHRTGGRPTGLTGVRHPLGRGRRVPVRDAHQVHDDPGVGQRVDLERAVRRERHDHEVAVDVAGVPVVEHGGLGPPALAAPHRDEPRPGRVGHGDLHRCGTCARRQPGLHGDRRVGRRAARRAGVRHPARRARRVGGRVSHDVDDDVGRLGHEDREPAVDHRDDHEVAVDLVRCWKSSTDVAGCSPSPLQTVRKPAPAVLATVICTAAAAATSPSRVSTVTVEPRAGSTGGARVEHAVGGDCGVHVGCGSGEAEQAAGRPDSTGRQQRQQVARPARSEPDSDNPAGSASTRRSPPCRRRTGTRSRSRVLLGSHSSDSGADRQIWRSQIDTESTARAGRRAVSSARFRREMEVHAQTAGASWAERWIRPEKGRNVNRRAHRGGSGPLRGMQHG